MVVDASIPNAPGSLPLIGHTGALIRDPLRFLASAANVGDLVQIRIGPVKAVAVCDPDLARHVFRNDRVFDKGGPVFDLLKEVTGHRAMVVMGYGEHKRRRRIVQPAFHPTRFEGYADTVLDQVDAVMNTWHTGQSIDVLREMKLITARTGLLTMFTYMQPEWVLSRALADSIVVMNGLFRRVVAPSFVNRLPTPANTAFNRANARLRGVVDLIVDEYRKHGVDCGDMLSSLLNAAQDESDTGDHPRLTNTDVHDEVTVFFLAAMDTTASALAWTLAELMHRPEVHARVREEMSAELAGRRACFADLPKLTYTTQVVNEVLRLHPPVWLLTRNVTEDTELGGHPVKAGSAILVSPYLIHHREDVFPDPARFDVDRWDESRVTRQARNALLPFGFGARKCIGDVFGMTELMLVLARVIPNWDLESVSGERARSSTSFVLSPREFAARLTKPA